MQIEMFGPHTSSAPSEETARATGTDDRASGVSAVEKQQEPAAPTLAVVACVVLFFVAVYFLTRNAVLPIS